MWLLSKVLLFLLEMNTFLLPKTIMNNFWCFNSVISLTQSQKDLFFSNLYHILV